MSGDGDRLRAIQMLARLCSIGATDENEDAIAEAMCTSLFALGVTREELEDAMAFALITLDTGEDVA